MAVSKVILNGQTLIDVTEDTVASNNLLQGNQATGADGQKVSGAYVAPTFSTQSKTATPSESQQTILPDSGYDGLSKVTVSAIPSDYVGTSITKKAAQTYTPGTTDQTIAAGQYLSGAQTILGDANLLASNIASGVSIFGVQGTHQGGGGTDVDERFIIAAERRPISQLAMDGVSVIGTSAFYFWSTLTGVIASDCIEIKDYAFANCYGLSTIQCDQCSAIGNYAFYNTSYLGSLSFKECLTIGKGAFASCAISASDTTVFFPKCVSIGQSAFSQAGFISVSFPECIVIDSAAFYRASRLISANFPNCVTISGSSTFSSCSALNYVSLPKCEVIGWGCFADCSSLTSIDLPACTIVSQNAFLRCSLLEHISLPICQSVGQYAFNKCSMLSEIILPKCSRIGNGAFSSCYELKTAVANECTFLGSSAFNNCSALEVVSFPALVSIYESTFSGCSNLKSVYFLGSSVVKIVSIHSLQPVTQETFYYVPASLYSAYLSAYYWSQISSRIVSVQL